MQRRKFITISAIATTAIGITGIGCGQRHPAYYTLLDKPEVLSQLCDLKTLREIGSAYQKQTSTVSESDKLIALILSDSTGNTVPASADNAMVQTLIRQKINRDFETGRTVVVRGWVLSETEARQCALLFANNP